MEPLLLFFFILASSVDEYKSARVPWFTWTLRSSQSNLCSCHSLVSERAKFASTGKWGTIWRCACNHHSRERVCWFYKMHADGSQVLPYSRDCLSSGLSACMGQVCVCCMPSPHVYMCPHPHTIITPSSLIQRLTSCSLCLSCSATGNADVSVQMLTHLSLVADFSLSC